MVPNEGLSNIGNMHFTTKKKVSLWHSHLCEFGGDHSHVLRIGNALGLKDNAEFWIGKGEISVSMSVNFLKLEKLNKFVLVIVARTKTKKRTNTNLLIGINKELKLISSLIKLVNIVEVWRTYTQEDYMTTGQNSCLGLRLVGKEGREPMQLFGVL